MLLANSRFSNTVSLSANIKGDVCLASFLNFVLKKREKKCHGVCVGVLKVISFLHNEQGRSKLFSYIFYSCGNSCGTTLWKCGVGWQACWWKHISCYKLFGKLQLLGCDFSVLTLFVAIKGKVSSHLSCHKQFLPPSHMTRSIPSIWQPSLNVICFQIFNCKT